MARINRDRSRGGDDDFAGVGEEPTFPARYAGRCATCGRRFAVGDPIAAIVVDKATTYHHGACRYPATAFLAEADGNGVGVGDTVRCKATTAKGTPCRNTPQHGEEYCGPHLTQLGT